MISEQFWGHLVAFYRKKKHENLHVYIAQLRHHKDNTDLCALCPYEAQIVKNINIQSFPHCFSVKRNQVLFYQKFFISHLLLRRSFLKAKFRCFYLLLVVTFIQFTGNLNYI